MSRLPVRQQHRPPPSALPRPPLSSLPLQSTSALPPPPPLLIPPTPARSVADISRFDLDHLLDEQTDDSGFLLDDNAPSWLADQSACTLGGRTPAKDKGKGRMQDLFQMSIMEMDDSEEYGKSLNMADNESMLESTVEQVKAVVNPDKPDFLTILPPHPPSPAPPAIEPPAHHTPGSSPAQHRLSPVLENVALPASPISVEKSQAIDTDDAELAQDDGRELPAAADVSAAIDEAMEEEAEAIVQVETEESREQAEEDEPTHEEEHHEAVPPSPKRSVARHRPSLAPLSTIASSQPLDNSPEFDTSAVPLPAPLPNSVTAHELSILEEVSEEWSAEDPPAPLPATTAIDLPLPADDSPLPPPAASLIFAAAPLLPTTSIAAPPITHRPAPRPRASLPASRPAHLLPANHPSHPRPRARASLAAPPTAASWEPSQPLAKKNAEEKGVKEADEEQKRRVREMKEERERKAAERVEAQKSKAAVSGTRTRKVSLAPVPVKEEAAEALEKGEGETEKLAQEAAELLAALQAPIEVEVEAPTSVVPPTPPTCRDDPPSPPPPAAADDTPPSPVFPTFAFDGDTTLPSMGAPLDLGASGLGSQLQRERGGVTSTPAKRKAVEEEEEQGQEERGANDDGSPIPETGREQQKKKARRTTLAVSALPSLAEVVEVSVEATTDEAVETSASGPVEKPKPRRRPSRVSFASTDDHDHMVSFALAAPPTTSATSSTAAQGKAVRVTLVAPEFLAPTTNLRQSFSGTSSLSLSTSQRRPARVSLGPLSATVEQSQSILSASTSAALSASSSTHTLPRCRPSTVAPALEAERPSAATSLVPPAATAEQISNSLEASTLSRSHRRASRVSLAPPPPTPPSTRPTTADTLAVETVVSAANLKVSTSRRASRVPLDDAPPPSSTTAHAPPAPPPPPPAVKRPIFSSSVPPSSTIPLLTTSTSLSASLSSATRPHHPPIKAPAIPAPISHLTLPASFHFAASDAERDAEKERRREERERRERVAEEKVRERKGKREREGGGWAAGVKGKKEKVERPQKREEREEKAREVEVKAQTEAGRAEGAKRPKLSASLPVPPLPSNDAPFAPAPPLAASVSTSATVKAVPPPSTSLDLPPRQPRSRLSSSQSLTASRPRPRRSFVDAQTGEEMVVSSAPAPSPRTEVAVIAPAVEEEVQRPELTEEETVPLTKAALETNTRRSGSRGDLIRRVSRFLEEVVVEEGEEEQAVTAGERAEAEVVVAAEELVMQVEVKEEAVEEMAAVELIAPQPPINASPPIIVAPSPASVVFAPVAVPPPPPPAPARKPVTTTAKPFVFGASRSSRPAAAVTASTAADTTASPMFVERLSSWKAREAKLSLNTSKNKSSPAATAGSRVRRALGAAAPVPPPPPPVPAAVSAARKRPRVEPTVPVTHPLSRPLRQQQQKENRPASSLSVAAPPAKKRAIREIEGGGVKAELEKQLKEKMEWSERQKRREEEVKARRERDRVEEADREREKLKQLRASLAVSRGPPRAALTAGKGKVVRGAGRM